MRGDTLAALAVSAGGHAAVIAAAIIVLGSATVRRPDPPVTVSLALPNGQASLPDPPAPPVPAKGSDESSPMAAVAAWPAEPSVSTAPAMPAEAVAVPAAPLAEAAAVYTTAPEEGAPVAEPAPDHGAAAAAIVESPASQAEPTAGAALPGAVDREMREEAASPTGAPLPAETAVPDAPAVAGSQALAMASVATVDETRQGGAERELGAIRATTDTAAASAATEAAPAAAADRDDVLAPSALVPPPALPWGGTGDAKPRGPIANSVVSLNGETVAMAPIRPAASLAEGRIETAVPATAAAPQAGAALAPHTLAAVASAPSVSPRADPATPPQTLAALEVAPLGATAPNQQATFAPDLVQAAVREQVRAFLRAYDGGPCFYAVPRPGASAALAINGFAPAPAAFAVLDWAFKARVRREPAVVGSRIWSAQCGAVDRIRALMRHADDQTAPEIEIAHHDLQGDAEVEGRVRYRSDRPLGLFLITEAGQVQDMSRTLVREGGAARFAFRPDHPAVGGPFPQMIVAVMADTAVPRNPATIDDLFKPLLAHPEAQPSAATALVLLTR